MWIAVVRAPIGVLLAATCSVCACAATSKAEPSSSSQSNDVVSDPSVAQQVEYMRAAKREIQRCFKREDVKNPADMLRCSGYLVAPKDLASCLSKTESGVCLVSRTCKTEAERTAGFGCIEVSHSGEEAIAMTATAFPYPRLPQTLESIPQDALPSPDTLRRLQDCEVRERTKGPESVIACSERALLPPELQEVSKCVVVPGRDVLGIALHCVGPDVPALALPLSEAEQAVLRCGIAAASKFARDNCIKPVTDERLRRLFVCAVPRTSPMVIGACLRGVEVPIAIRAGSECFTANSRDSLAACAKSGLFNLPATKFDPNAMAQELEKAANCVNQTSQSLEATVACASGASSDPVAQKAVSEAESCVRSARDGSAKLLDCAKSPALTKLGECWDKYRGDPFMVTLNCGPGSKMKEVEKASVSCAGSLMRTSNPEEALHACREGLKRLALGQVGEDVSKAVDLLPVCKNKYSEEIARGENEAAAKTRFAVCVAGPSNEVAGLTCMLQEQPKSALGFAAACGSSLKGAVPGVDQALKIAECYEKFENDSRKMAACIGIPGNKDASRVLACLQESSATAATLCVAGPKLPKEVQVLGDCAVKAGADATAAAACAAQAYLPGVLKGLNPEWQAAAECAATSGGEPTAAASCTATRLAIAELTKCFTKGIGKPGGCFGPNNTLVKFWNGYMNTLKHPAGGKNSEIRRAGRATDKYFLQPVRKGVLSIWEVTGPTHSFRVSALAEGRVTIKGPSLPRKCSSNRRKPWKIRCV